MAVDGYLPNKRAGSLNIFREPAFLLYFCGGNNKHYKILQKNEENKHAYDAGGNGPVVQLSERQCQRLV